MPTPTPCSRPTASWSTRGSLAAHRSLRQALVGWLDDARRAGLDDDSIDVLFQTTFRGSAGEGVA